MARKSTIPNPDDYIPTSDELLDGVVQRRRERSGRTPPENIASNTAIQQYDNTAVNTDVQQEIQQYDTVGKMFATTPIVVTIRLPEAVSEWLAEEAHKGRKSGMTKQRQIWDALREYIEKRIAEE